MTILNFIEKLYENSYFTTSLLAATVVLIVLFFIVLILGIRDAKKSKIEPEIENDDIKDVTFDIPSELNNIKEDVTFEMPSLTKNLEDFKKSLEEEMQIENNDIELKPTNDDKALIDSTRPVKILDINEIEDTVIIPKLKIKENDSESSNDETETDVINPSKVEV